LNAIKEVNPDLPIVIFSSHHDNDIALDAVRGGAQEFVVKGEGSSRMLALSVLSSIERKRYERHLFKLANHDSLTGLPNRRMFQEYIKHWLARAERWQRTEAIMFIDVNGFKKVNDTLGHDIGDELLTQIAARLKVGLRASDMLARYAGDEFIVHLDMGATISEDTCAQLAEKSSECSWIRFASTATRFKPALASALHFSPRTAGTQLNCSGRQTRQCTAQST
jgi:diguanylate cyclase (GGDEF)-like protein